MPRVESSRHLSPPQMRPLLVIWVLSTIDLGAALPPQMLPNDEVMAAGTSVMSMPMQFALPRLPQMPPIVKSPPQMSPVSSM